MIIEIIVIVFYWLIHIIWTVGVANNKNRGLLVWAILGLLFGPLAFGTVLALPKLKNKENLDDE